MKRLGSRKFASVDWLKPSRQCGMKYKRAEQRGSEEDVREVTRFRCGHTLTQAVSTKSDMDSDI
jgi:hypothetical protein